MPNETIHVAVLELTGSSGLSLANKCMVSPGKKEVIKSDATQWHAEPSPIPPAPCFFGTSTYETSKSKSSYVIESMVAVLESSRIAWKKYSLTWTYARTYLFQIHRESQRENWFFRLNHRLVARRPRSLREINHMAKTAPTRAQKLIACKQHRMKFLSRGFLSSLHGLSVGLHDLCGASFWSCCLWCFSI